MVLLRLKTTELRFSTFSYLHPHKRSLNYNILSKQKPSEQLPDLTGECRQFSFLISSMQRKGQKEERRQGKNELLLFSVLTIWGPVPTEPMSDPGTSYSQESQVSSRSQGHACVSEKQHLIEERDYAAQSDTPKFVYLLLLSLCVI